ncbi:DMT family transporter [Desulfovibrio gilichinskyi]|uniref:Small multidrug resistance pump n=1 Tax=Desulfovibrio gilichinskyi TaxID=1519643 RepID=A0A1X7CZ06_9BACT|nr:multidrug efflux SMR transporter [Desulfovibrio gilichinskyi]SMF05684.1 small multidrug resistance pump [Desulfovibrio gilichinskyi]
MLESWMILIASIICEVSGTSCLKLSDGFSKIIPTVSVFVFYGLSMWGLSVVLKKMDVGVAYAVWSGLGTAIVVLIGIFFFGERITPVRFCSLLFIVIGVIGLNYSPGAQ